MRWIKGKAKEKRYTYTTVQIMPCSDAGRNKAMPQNLDLLITEMEIHRERRGGILAGKT